MPATEGVTGEPPVREETDLLVEQRLRARYPAATEALGRYADLLATDGVVRGLIGPREVGRLHRTFLAAKLPVQFRPEHRFLVAVNERGNLMGGLFYEVQAEAGTAHMDKVVVAERYQRKGVAAALLQDLCKRLTTAGIGSLTTGFFRPQFFYRLGFVIEGRYAGLVKSLADDGGG